MRSVLLAAVEQAEDSWVRSSSQYVGVREGEQCAVIVYSIMVDPT